MQKGERSLSLSLSFNSTFDIPTRPHCHLRQPTTPGVCCLSFYFYKAIIEFLSSLFSARLVQMKVTGDLSYLDTLRYCPQSCKNLLFFFPFWNSREISFFFCDRGRTFLDLMGVAIHNNNSSSFVGSRPLRVRSPLQPQGVGVVGYFRLPFRLLRFSLYDET